MAVTPPAARGHVFISYARADGSDHARRLERALRLEGFTTWRDVRDIDPSADFTSSIENAISAALAVILCVTRDVTRPDSFVRREIAFAQMEKRPIVVARFTDVAPPISVITNTRIDFHASDEIALAQLLRFLRRADSAGSGLPDTEINAYLAALYHEIVDRLQDAVLLPVVGRRMQLLEAAGLMSRAAGASPGRQVLSEHFQPAPGPIAVAGIRQAWDYARQRLAIVGDAGSGKTVALLTLARDLASEAITDPDQPLPVVVSAATWGADGNGEDGLIPWLARQVPVLADAIPGLLQAGRVILLIDGLDELPRVIMRAGDDERRNPRAELTAELTAACPLVIASRPAEILPAAADLGVAWILELQPLTDAQVDAFIAPVPAVAAIIAQDGELRAAARTPLMLSLLCSAVDAASSRSVGHLAPSEARDLIVRAYIESRYQREYQRKRPAFQGSFSLADLYRGLGSIAMSDAGGGGNRNIFNMGEVRSALGHDDIYSLVLDAKIMIPAGPRTLRFFHITLRDHFAFHYAQKALHDPDPGIRDSAAWALWQIPDRRVVSLLIEALRDPYPYARGSAASALGQIGDRRALGPLQALLADQALVISMYGDTIADVARWAITQIEQGASLDPG